MAHAAFYDNEKMIWIEGIRVNMKIFEKMELLKKMISHFEKMQITRICTTFKNANCI